MRGDLALDAQRDAWMVSHGGSHTISDVLKWDASAIKLVASAHCRKKAGNSAVIGSAVTRGLCDAARLYMKGDLALDVQCVIFRYQWRIGNRSYASLSLVVCYLRSNSGQLLW